MVRRNWPERLGPAPKNLISGVPQHVDGRMLAHRRGRPARRSSTATACGTTSRASATGTRSGATTASASCPRRRRCGSTRRATGCRSRCSRASTRSRRCATSARPAHDHTWFVLTRKIIEREFALSGSEQNPDITGRSIRELIKTRVASGRARPDPEVHGPRRGLRRRARPARARGGDEPGRRPASTSTTVEREVVARDREIDNPFTKDAQVTAIRGARRYLADRITPRRHAAPAARPGRRAADRGQAQHPHPQDARRPADRPRRRAAWARTGRRSPGLYAAGEVAGFGGGGMHGYNSLEGTFVGGCMFSGRAAGRALARSL